MQRSGDDVVYGERFLNLRQRLIRRQKIQLRPALRCLGARALYTSTTARRYGSMAVCPTKSSADERDYRILQLPNKLQVLLCSDAVAEKSSAAMDVHVGHFSDPEQVAGLAHFCEHMLFLGPSHATLPVAGFPIPTRSPLTAAHCRNREVPRRGRVQPVLEPARRHEQRLHLYGKHKLLLRCATGALPRSA